MPRAFWQANVAQWLVVALHVAFVAAVLSVPLHAFADAFLELRRPDGAALAELLRDMSRWAILLRSSAIVCGTAAAVNLLLGTLLAVITARTDTPGRTIILGLLLFAACLPLHVTAALLIAIVPTYWLSGSALACGIVYGVLYAPLAALVLHLVFRGVDAEQEEQTLLDAGAARTFWHITLRQARWGFAAVVVIVTWLVATDITITDILTVRTFAEETYSQFVLDQRRAGPLLTSLPMLCFLAGLTAVALLRGRQVGTSSPDGVALAPRRFRLGRWRWGLASVTLAALVGALALPLAAVIGHLLPWQPIWPMVTDIGAALLRSFVLGTAAAVVIVAASVGLAWSIVRTRWLRWLTLAIVLVLLALPAPVVGISLIGLLNRPGWLGDLYDSPAVVTCGYIVRFLPVGVLLLLPAVRRVPLELLHAARADGCNWLQTQWHVYWPFSRRLAVLAGLILLVLCYSEIGATVLITPPGGETAAGRAFTLLHFGIYRDVALLTLLSAALILLPWAALVWLLRSGHRRPTR